MDDSSSHDLELLLLAVQHGVLSNSQVEECLHEWEERQATGAGVSPAAPLATVAVAKGFLSEKRLRELSQKRTDPAATAVRVEVVMACRDCKTERTYSIEAALRKPPCAKCSGGMRFKRSSGSTSVKSRVVPLPEEVRTAMADPKNRFTKYVLLSKLGAGGMAEVWRAWDTVLNRAVALKFPKTTGEDEVRRLYLEAQGAGSLSHPNVASIYEIAEAEGRHYIAMQYIEGKTADERIKEKKDDMREVVRWVRDAARGVHYAHERGVIHRDLKPANIMIDIDGRVLVMDFGLAKLTGGEGSATVSGVILGTPAFMPPEQAAGNTSQIDRRADVYSMGAMLYVLLSGKRPFEGESATDILVQILTSEPPTLRQAWPQAPWELEAIVARAMSRPRDQRYDTAKDFADDLERWMANEPIHARRQGISVRITGKLRRHRTTLAAVGACLAILAVAGVFYARTPSANPGATANLERMKEWRELFGQLNRALAPNTFDRAVAAPLLERVEREYPDQKPAIDVLVESGGDEIKRALDTLLPREWLDSAPRVRKYREWLEFFKKPTDAADRVLAYRGTFGLTIQVVPYAEVRGPFVEGLPAEERFTPLTLRGLEIREGSVELVHPQHGRQVVRLPPVRNGGMLTIEGDLKIPSSIKVSEGP